MVRAVDRIVEIGGGALQIFSDNPTAWRRRTEPPGEQAAFRARLGELGVGPIAIHAPYLVNLAGPDEELYRRSVEILASELAVAPGFGARYVNVHVGSHRGVGRDAGIARLGEGIERVFDLSPAGVDAPLLVLENSAGGGFAIGTTVEDLAAVVDAVAARGVDTSRIGFCLDTAHLWGFGYDMGDPGAIDQLLARIDTLMGLERVAMVHLNDSKAERGSRYDRHEHLGAGRIGIEGLGHLLGHPALARVPHFLETPGMEEGYDALNVTNALRIAAGLPIEPVPPEAMAVRGARGRTPPD
jgi:deoxyribonuclease-4